MDPEFDELKREFLVEADAKVSEIEGLLAPAGKLNLDRMGYLAHQLKGAGGSYGFSAISREAAELENVLEILGQDSNRDESTELQRRIDNLHSEISQRQRELAQAS